ncbi:TAXI family TRAP transporter solute-binding subunit [Janibacter alkaliphilus]|uniref:TRAP transporter solute receptor, TAXI family n=1 Tax=Janibacter alkaliphilus TaxID=1069963 RepID=A0A852XCN6_9MICO|nr:hypothetical protein [Janibacter alkaliphilus]
MRRRHFLGLGLAGAVGALTACGEPKGAAYVDGRLSMAVVTTYGTGTATYADMAAVADAVTQESGIRTRIMTSDTAIGRLTPLREGLATFSRTGDEYIFAREAQHEFLSRDWGPQPTRVVWAPTAPHGLLTREDTGIVDLADLRGRRIPDITANPSVNGKIEVALIAAGLTREDVQLVPISYGEQAEGLKSGKIDILFQQVYGSSLFELESSTPVRWVRMEKGDEALRAAIDEVNPSLTLGDFTGAPGQEEGSSDVGYVYAIPIITYAGTDEATVHEFASAIVDSFEIYQDATSTSRDWAPESAVTTPQQVPFHAGLVRLLRERDLWSPQAQQIQDQLLEREERLVAGWEQVTAAHPEGDLTGPWTEWKEQNLD